MGLADWSVLSAEIYRSRTKAQYPRGIRPSPNGSIRTFGTLIQRLRIASMWGRTEETRPFRGSATLI